METNIINLHNIKTILVLEDNPVRIEWFIKSLKDCSTTFCINATDAIECLKTNLYDLIFLDHDLGGKVMVNSDEPNTGYQVAKIIPNSINKDTSVIIHSYNITGVERMQHELPNAKYAPFGTFRII